MHFQSLVSEIPLLLLVLVFFFFFFFLNSAPRRLHFQQNNTLESVAIPGQCGHFHVHFDKFSSVFHAKIGKNFEISPNMKQTMTTTYLQ